MLGNLSSNATNNNPSANDEKSNNTTERLVDTWCFCFRTVIKRLADSGSLPAGLPSVMPGLRILVRVIVLASLNGKFFFSACQILITKSKV